MLTGGYEQTMTAKMARFTQGYKAGGGRLFPGKTMPERIKSDNKKQAIQNVVDRECLGRKPEHRLSGVFQWFFGQKKEQGVTAGFEDGIKKARQ